MLFESVDEKRPIGYPVCQSLYTSDLCRVSRNYKCIINNATLHSARETL